ncbi:hypothetical protein ATANTOWER_015597 [Ataeniobius toweri]|uniref:Uncharacterized protein n=1 Tax=Ataeniobius toweri TaxID=208326 RepID=A0ABU7AQA7_9TELE|nr:hypothetical protein [Ataeniobius toweri]
MCRADTSSTQQSEPGGTKVGGANCIILWGSSPCEVYWEYQPEHSAAPPSHQPAKHTFGSHGPPDRGQPPRQVAPCYAVPWCCQSPPGHLHTPDPTEPAQALWREPGDYNVPPEHVMAGVYETQLLVDSKVFPTLTPKL